MKKILSDLEVSQFNPLSLASVGDAVHTLFVRETLFERDLPPNKLHLLASKFCRAKNQSLAYEKILGSLSDLEREIATRARNHKGHAPKNSSLEEYKKATAFEAIVGYLYVTGKTERLEEILKCSLEEE